MERWLQFRPTREGGPSALGPTWLLAAMEETAFSPVYWTTDEIGRAHGSEGVRTPEVRKREERSCDGGREALRRWFSSGRRSRVLFRGSARTSTAFFSRVRRKQAQTGALPLPSPPLEPRTSGGRRTKHGAAPLKREQRRTSILSALREELARRVLKVAGHYTEINRLQPPPPPLRSSAPAPHLSLPGVFQLQRSAISRRTRRR